MKKSLNLDLLEFHVREATQELDLLLDLIQYAKDETRWEGNLAITIAKMKAPKMAPAGTKTNLQGHGQVVRGLCHS